MCTTSAATNHGDAFHLFSSQSDHVQGAVHEATDQSLGSILGGNDVIYSVVGCDVLRFTTKEQDIYYSGR